MVRRPGAFFCLQVAIFKCRIHCCSAFDLKNFLIVNSTAAARLNGYAGGNGTREQLLREIHLLGMDDSEKKGLEKRVGG